MRFLKVAEARARFGDMLDEAESGATVIIERRGVRFELSAPAAAKPAVDANTPLFDRVDAALLAGQWTWKAGAKGLTFGPRRRKR